MYINCNEKQVTDTPFACCNRFHHTYAPDNGSRIIKFNERHGPSYTDLAGLSLILIAWGYSLHLIIRYWKRIIGKVAKQNIFLLLLLYCCSLVIIILSLLLSNELLLWSAIAVASVINITFAFLAISTSDN